MARTVTRPHIVVQAVYTGGMDMQEMFISLLVNEVRRGKSSVRTFEIVKDTEYNEDRTKTRLIEGMKQAPGITERLKEENALEWVGRMNNIRACAMEIVNEEIIYA